MRVTVIGTGYVGLVTGVCLAHIGHEVVCVDSSAERVTEVQNGRIPFHEPGLAQMLAAALEAGNFQASTDALAAVAGAQITFLAVGTPSRDGDIDLGFIQCAAEDVAEGMRSGEGYHVVVVKSTVVPGTTEKVVGRIIAERSQRKAGEFGLCMNPEFLREGTAVADFLDPDRIVIGQSDERAGEALAEVYRSFRCPKVFTSLQNAELIKYASNTLLAAMISFSNELAAICEATPGTDVETVLRGVHLDRRITTMVGDRAVVPGMVSYLRAGCGFGGSCLPKDVTALRAYARKLGVATHLLDAVEAVNVARPARVVDIVEQVAGSLKGASVGVLGIAFKPGTDDLRDSPALAIIRELARRECGVRAYDPLVPRLPTGIDAKVCESIGEALEGVDAAIIASALPELASADWVSLSKRMRRAIVIDGRSALRDVVLPQGLKYVPIGRQERGMTSDV